MFSDKTRTTLIIGAAAAAATLSTVTVAQQAAAPGAPAAAPATPRLADGHPDLTGLLGGGVGLPNFADAIVFNGRGNSFQGYEADGGLLRTAQLERNFPKYKPQYWAQIIENEYMGNWDDPDNSCMPKGVPRQGAPAQIFALKDQPMVLLLYGNAPTRVVPTDGRAHNLAAVAAESWYGDPVGHWEGDTLVIESIGFTDSSWLTKSGHIHGFNMKVTERLTRTGNTLAWSAVVDDPEYLTEPWSPAPATRNYNLNPAAMLAYPLPCNDLDRGLAVSHTRSGDTG